MEKDPRRHQNTQLLSENFLGACEKLYTAKTEAQLIKEIHHLSELLRLGGKSLIRWLTVILFQVFPNPIREFIFNEITHRNANYCLILTFS